jgi:uncharacterized Zn-binding protein involved in type VI secretion
MPQAGRLGDNAMVPVDAHGCVACPHVCIGPAITGAPTVLINGRPALRVTDKGIHAACCGPNMWTAIQGSPTVIIESQQAHRLGDTNQHCGGVGKLIEGSVDVIIGP